MPRAAKDPLAPEESLQPRSRAAGRSPARVAFLVLALVFFMGPLAIVAVGGAGGPLARERHVPAPALSQGWGLFDRASLFLEQRLPLRGRAVSANTWVSRNIFGTSPRYGSANGGDQALPFARLGGAGAGYAQNGGALTGHAVVALGRGHWDYLQGELDILCRPPVGIGTAVGRWRSFVDELRASGRRVVLLVVPEKSTIYPERLPTGTPSWSCARPHKQRLWHEVESLRDPSIVGLRMPLAAQRRRDPGQLLYLPYDSHWNDLGALLAVRRALGAVGGGVQVGSGDVSVGSRHYTGDIAPFVGGGPTGGTAPAVRIARPGETIRTTFQAGGPLNGGGRGVTVRQGPPGSAIPGTTLYLHDSFGDATVPMLEHYAARLLIAPWLLERPAHILALLRGARTVILETSERDFLNRAAIGTPQSVLTPAFLRAVAALGPPQATAPPTP